MKFGWVVRHQQTNKWYTLYGDDFISDDPEAIPAPIVEKLRQQYSALVPKGMQYDILIFGLPLAGFPISGTVPGDIARMIAASDAVFSFQETNRHLGHRWNFDHYLDLSALAKINPRIDYAVWRDSITEQVADLMNAYHVYSFTKYYVAVDGNELLTMLRIMNVPLIELSEVRD